MSDHENPRLHEVEVQAIDAARLEPLIGAERMAQFEQAAEVARETLAGNCVLNVNSTGAGGGVAEMLQTLLSYARGAGVDARWLVIEGDPAFFAITKRVHNGLYGSPGDGGNLGRAEHRHYEHVLRTNAHELLALVRPGDVVVVHDPQPAGLVAAVKGAGARVVWRCHVGLDRPNEWSERAWEFLRPYLADADAVVVSRAAFAPPWADPAQVHVIRPSIDPFSAKNEPISSRNARLTLSYVGLLDGSNETPPAVPFTRRDGSPGRINRRVDIVQTGPPAPADVPFVVQISRWDRLKDMAGVMEAFADHVDPSLGAHLLLCGPVVTGVADDPEAAEVLDECTNLWRELPHAARSRVHLACIPMADPDENAAIVNAIQRHASVVVQKSLAEGFGLTVAEAMWKRRPVVASAVGGIVDQIEDGTHGLLVDDPTDLPAFGAAVESLLRDRGEAGMLAQNARRRVVDEFLGDRHLEQFGRLFEQLADEPG
ncbi:MAG TPA: glycosyltransferase [Gaiellaceae bacterium]|jgi:trehalose synthase|nr:glycosyltransferase [Gaiellaceae bacterium]